MPELPEVETSRRGIYPYLKDQKIKQIIVRNSKLRWVIDDAIYQAEHQQIIDIKRRAKYILIELEQGWIVIHLGMSGSLRIIDTQIPPQKHDHVDLILNNGIILRYTDPRRFGAWLWTPFLEWLPQLKNLAPEPLSDEFSPLYLHEKLKRTKSMIKKIIMNNAIVVGVGNIYASESLFRAKISPIRISHSLTFKEVTCLVASIKIILEDSIKQGGTTLKDFLNSEGKPGYFSQQLKVYGRENKPCFNCGELIHAQIISQRNTFYCPNCQK